MIYQEDQKCNQNDFSDTYHRYNENLSSSFLITVDPLYSQTPHLQIHHLANIDLVTPKSSLIPSHGQVWTCGEQQRQSRPNTRRQVRSSLATLCLLVSYCKQVSFARSISCHMFLYFCAFCWGFCCLKWPQVPC